MSTTVVYDPMNRVPKNNHDYGVVCELGFDQRLNAKTIRERAQKVFDHFNVPILRQIEAMPGDVLSLLAERERVFQRIGGLVATLRIVEARFEEHDPHLLLPDIKRQIEIWVAMENLLRG